MTVDTHVHVWEMPPVAPVAPTAPSRYRTGGTLRVITARIISLTPEMSMPVWR